MNIPTIDPNAPTRSEVIAHNMKIAKANLASELAGKLCESQNHVMSAEQLAKYAISVAETIIETYSLMPDGSGNKRGLV